jgi:hypothetical protein
MPRTFTTGQICRLYGVAPWQIMQAIKRGFLREPVRVGIYRIWIESELPTVRAALVNAGYLSDEVPAHA